MKKVKLVWGGVRVIYDLPLRLISLHCYAALLPRRGPHIASHSVCLSVRLSVRPAIVAMVTSFRQPLASRMYCPASVTSRHLANYNDTDVLFARTEGRISYGHLGRTNSCSFCFSFTCVDSVCCWILINLI